MTTTRLEAPESGPGVPLPHVDWHPDPIHPFPPNSGDATPFLKSPDGRDIQITDKSTPSQIWTDLSEMTRVLPADLQTKLLKGAIDATTEFMKDKGGFDYKPTGDPDKDWAAISRVLDGLSPGDQNKLMIKILDSTTKVLQEENEKYKNGPFGDNVRANYLYEKQQRHEPLTEHERNELNGFEEFRDSVYLGYLAGRQLNHEPLTPQQENDLYRARTEREEKFDWRRMPQ